MACVRLVRQYVQPSTPGGVKNIDIYIYIYYNYIGGDCGEGNEMTTPSVLQCMLTVDEEDSA